MQSTLLEWIKYFVPIVLSWPVVGFIALLMFRKPIYQILQQFGSGELRKAKVGPIELERELTKLAEQGQRAVTNLDRINELMAESRLLELEITESMFATVFSKDQQKKMHAQIDELKSLTRK